MIFDIIKLIDALGMNKTQFADYCNMPRSTVSDILSGRMKHLPDQAVVKLIKEKNINANWLLTNEGDIFRSYEAQKSDVAKNLALVGKLNRNAKLKKLVELIVAIEEEHYGQIEAILKTFSKK